LRAQIMSDDALAMISRMKLVGGTFTYHSSQLFTFVSNF